MGPAKGESDVEVLAGRYRPVTNAPPEGNAGVVHTLEDHHDPRGVSEPGAEERVPAVQEGEEGSGKHRRPKEDNDRSAAHHPSSVITGILMTAVVPSPCLLSNLTP